MPRGRLLLADNNPVFLATRAQFLRAQHYRVFAAGSVEEAEQLLQDSWIHLAILDIRLEDDNDDKDISGLLLAKKETYRHIPKIILTGHPTYEAVRIALGPVLDGLPPAVDFLAKLEGLEAMLQAVEKVFARHVRINWDLVIQRSEHHPIILSHLVSLIEPELEDEYLAQRAEELEELLRRLFFEKRQINLTRLLWQHQGRIALVIVAFQEDRLPESFVVVCGQNRSMAETAKRYQAFAPKAPGETGTILNLQAEATHFAAHAYTLAGADLENTQTLAELYHTGPEKSFHAALEGSVQRTLTVWHQEKRVREDIKTLDVVYRERLHWSQVTLSPTAFAERVQTLVHQLPTLGLHIENTTDTHTLRYHGQAFSYPNPLPMLYRASPIGQPVLLTNAPGILSGENILADMHGRTWLTDFAEAGLAPVLWNAVVLEATIRFDWVKPDDLQALHGMEQCLMESPLSKLDMRDVEPVLRKPVRAMQILRRLVTHEVGTDIAPYHLGLLFQAMHRLTSFNPAVQLAKNELTRLAHALLAAAMLCGEIEQDDTFRKLAQATQTATGVRIDQDNHAVWVKGVRIALTGQSYDLLCYLYTHTNHLCTRRDLVEQVLRQQYDEMDGSQISRLNTAIRRLREKIEDNPSQPRYLLTEPGGGYRLVLHEGM